jgi:predicted Zn-ribbon and HTH transcriptional regulator
LTLPDWIQYNKKQGHYVLLESCICERCNFKWFPRIQEDGTMKLKICPKCKSPLWNVKRKSL